MNIVIIGSGKVAKWLAVTLNKNNYKILLHSRNKTAGNEIASKNNLLFIDDIHNLPVDADYYLIAVKDDAIAEVVNNLPQVKGIIAHTSGSAEINVLKAKSERYGVIWPVASIQNEPYNKDVNVVVEASDSTTSDELKKLSLTLSSRVYTLDYKQRQYLHLASVFANNFSNYFISIAENLLEKNKIPREIILPMLQQMIEKMKDNKASDLQTGPAIRNDRITLSKHMELLQENQQLAELYKKISEAIINDHLHDI